MLLTVLRLLNKSKVSIRHSSYVQGQAPPDRSDIREYFYYIDSFGQLFLDDTRFKNFTSCYKDPKFLHFFFTRVQANTYNDRPYSSTFPYVSLCGRERNFIRCADVPFVLTRLLDDNGLFECCHIPSTIFSIQFQPEKLYVKPDTGRIYYPLSEKFHTGIALIKDAIAEQLSSHLIYDDKIDGLPISIKWKGKIYELKKDNQIEKLVYEHSRFEI
ncbi:unnamed protein product [Adineta steineri]|uniref:Uncharacterized protein n=1 Tax=Adineta steineri TaxID=433720 RepID=A0A813QV60_9BILA|nr:unnamed protein product [Adineta steineri]CAF0772347.1 unnamed protein product [Adineta steineri]CAF3711746.1 unnamed protein product [Adineta steineri]CAF4302046.1 unnamed protein product [Adineta steineri]